MQKNSYEIDNSSNLCNHLFDGFQFSCATEIAVSVIPYLFVLSPFLVITMVLTILKDTTRSYPELGADEEWGYADKAKDQLGIL